MDVQVQAMKEAGRARLMIADMLWLIVFVSVWGGLIAFWNTWWALALVPAFAVMLAGLSEFMHQGVHKNLCGRVQLFNNFVGTVAAAMVGVDFGIYRDFHLDHHDTVNTPKDPERSFLYTHPGYAAKAGRWKERSWFSRFWSWLGATFIFGYLFGFSTHTWLVWVVRLAIPLAIAGIGYVEGLSGLMILAKVGVAWVLPFFIFVFVDFFLAQSEHYGMGDEPSARHVDNKRQYQISWNLWLPWPIPFMLFRRNLHAEHHENPGTHWWFARDKKLNRTLGPIQYLKSWWASGPRVMTPAPQPESPAATS